VDHLDLFVWERNKWGK